MHLLHSILAHKPFLECCFRLDIWHLLGESWPEDRKPVLNISNEVRDADAERIGQNLQSPNGNIAFSALQFPVVPVS